METCFYFPINPIKLSTFTATNKIPQSSTRSKMSQRSFKMELIKKESTRKHTFEKRKISLVKKISEISILCGVEACLIVYAPKREDEPAKLDTVWPPESDQVMRVIEKYRETNKAKRSYTVSDYFAEKKRKLDSEMSKLKKQINGAKYPCWDICLDSLSVDELMSLNRRWDHKIEVAARKLSLCRGNNKDLMLHLSENFGDYMNRKSNFPVLKQLQNKLPLPGPNLFMNPSNLNSQQPMLLCDSGLINRGKGVDLGQFEEGNMGSQMGGWGYSNVPIWQSQNYVNSLPWKLNSNMNNCENSTGSNGLQYMLPQMVAPISSMPYQLPLAHDKLQNGPYLMDLPASFTRSDGPNQNQNPNQYRM